MTNRVIIYPYKLASNGARELQATLRSRGIPTLRVKEDGKYRPREGDLIINWGNPRTPVWYQGGHILNPPANVRVASSKLDFLRWVQNEALTVPEWTQDRAVAYQWINEGSVVVARTLLRASGGRGIVLCNTPEELVDAPLYTKYVKKAAEYRIHVFEHEVIDIQQKRRRRDFEGEVDNKVRNYDRGWVFCREDVDCPQDVLYEATAAVSRCGLSFGAVDVIWNQHYQKAYVLEVNTSPGLEGTTVIKYADKVEELL